MQSAEQAQTPTANPEDLRDSEELFESFHEGLQMVSAVEKLYACKVLGIEEKRLDDIGKNFKLKDLEINSANLRELFYGSEEHRERYDAIISKAVAVRTEEEPDRYEALADSELMQLAKNLARAGLLFEFTSNRVKAAENQRQHSRELHQRHHRRPDKSVAEAAKVDDLIMFNHTVRDTVEAGFEGKIPLSRGRMRAILDTVLLGDTENAERVEKGMALEVATKHLFEELLNPNFGQSAIIYGTKGQDSRGGDLILFPEARRATYVDVKQTPPHNQLWKIDESEARMPGYRRKKNGNVCIWLGRDFKVENDYTLPEAFAETAYQVAHEVAAQIAIA